MLSEAYIIETDNGLEGVRRELFERGLPASLEATKFGAAFWTPRAMGYRTKSRSKSK